MNYESKRHVLDVHRVKISEYGRHASTPPKTVRMHQHNVFEHTNEVFKRMMCEECFKLITLRYHGFISVDLFEVDEHGIDFDVYPHINIFANRCPYCGQTDIKLIDLDYNIAPIISYLNKKGYHTYFSCEGHVNECFAYIFFKTNDILKYIDILPDSWYLDYGDLKEWKCVIRSNAVEHDDDKKDALLDLLEWVKKIPTNLVYNEE